MAWMETTLIRMGVYPHSYYISFHPDQTDPVTEYMNLYLKASPFVGNSCCSTIKEPSICDLNLKTITATLTRSVYIVPDGLNP